MPDETAEQRRARILALSAEDRAVLAGLIRKQLDRIPEQLAKLREDRGALTDWLAEFAPEMLPAHARPVAYAERCSDSHCDGGTAPYATGAPDA